MNYRALRRRRAVVLAACASLATTLASSAPGADLYWDSNGASPGAGFGGTWDTTTPNWTTDPAGASPTTAWLNDGSATAVFSAASIAANPYTVTLADGASLSANGLRFAELFLTLYPATGSSLTLTDPRINVGSASTGVILQPLSGNSGLITTGGGTLSLSGANNYAGPTKINNGTLRLDFATPGAPSNNIILSGWALLLGSPVSAPGSSPNATTLVVNGNNGATNNQGFTTAVIDPGASVIRVNSPTSGATNLALGEIFRNTGGTLTFVRPLAGMIHTTSSNTVGILGGWATVGVGATTNGIVMGSDWASVDPSGAIVPYAGYTDYNSGTGTLHSSVSAVTNLRIVSGTPQVNSDGAGTTTNINSIKGGSFRIGAGNTLRLGQQGGIFRSDITSANVFIGTTQNTGSLTAGGGADNQPGEIVFTVNSTAQNTGAIIAEVGVKDNGTGAVSVVKTGPGPLTFRGHNSYSGGTYINQGRFQLAGNENGGTPNPDGFGTGPVYIRPGGQAYLSGVGVSGAANNFFIAGIGTIGETFGALRLGGLNSINNCAGTVTLVGDARIVGDMHTSTPNIGAFTGQITGNHNLQIGTDASVFGIFGGSALVLSNPANNWTGNTSIVSSANLVSLLILGANQVIPDGPGKGNLLFGNPGSTISRANLDLAGFNETINGLSTPAGASVSQAFIENRKSASLSTLTVGNNDRPGHFGGIIRNGPTGGTVALTKIGAGVQVLSGSNTYTGPTVINGGTLRMGSSGALSATSAVTVNSSAALDMNGQPLARTTIINGGALVNSSPAVSNVSGAITLSGSSTISTAGNIVTTNSLSGTTQLTKTGPAALIVSGPQSWSSGSSLTVADGDVTFDTNAGALTGRTLMVNASGGDITFQATQSLFGLTVGANRSALLTAGGSRAIDTGSLTIQGAAGSEGLLDLANNRMIVRSGDVGAWNGASYSGIHGLIASGRNGGAWNGRGIITSQGSTTDGVEFKTLGLALASELASGASTFNGFTLNAPDVLLLHTFAGDANLNGFIDAADFARINANLGTATPTYSKGDFNYDGVIDSADLHIINTNFARQDIPEPALLAPLTVGLAALRRRRRRQRAQSE